MAEPYYFSWVVADQIACMGKPTRLRQELEFLKSQDIGLIISLTPTPLKRFFIDEFGFEYKHIPIEDFAAPTPEQADEFVAAVGDALARGVKVLVHCLAGKGRTGTMVSCFLVREGRSAAAAIAEMRRLRPGSIETREQEQAVHDYERRLRGAEGG